VARGSPRVRRTLSSCVSTHFLSVCFDFPPAGISGFLLSSSLSLFEEKLWGFLLPARFRFGTATFFSKGLPFIVFSQEEVSFLGRNLCSFTPFFLLLFLDLFLPRRRVARPFFFPHHFKAVAPPSFARRTRAFPPQDPTGFFPDLFGFSPLPCQPIPSFLPSCVPGSPICRRRTHHITNRLVFWLSTPGEPPHT